MLPERLITFTVAPAGNEIEPEVPTENTSSDLRVTCLGISSGEMVEMSRGLGGAAGKLDDCCGTGADGAGVGDEGAACAVVFGGAGGTGAGVGLATG